LNIEQNDKKAYHVLRRSSQNAELQKSGHNLIFINVFVCLMLIRYKTYPLLCGSVKHTYRYFFLSVEKIV